MTRRFLISLAVLAVGSFALSACGGSDDGSSSSTEASTTSAADTAANSSSSSASGATIDVAADPSGSLAFTETELSAPAGSDTISFTNDSSTPHNVVIEGADGSDVTETDTIQADSTTATADLQPGTYTFYCDVPGHREAGMEGTLTVE